MPKSRRNVRRAAYAALLLLAGSVLATPALGQTPERPEVKLTASDRVGGHLFGTSVALSGDTALVGAHGGTGRAYVFVRNGTAWTEQAKLTPSDAANRGFGFSVALSGDTALVGARGGPDAGSAYVFVRNGTTWTEQAKLTASDGVFADFFGWSVALRGDTALVGAPEDDFPGAPAALDKGSAYVFVRNGTTWTEQVKLTASDPGGGHLFGVSVALSGDTALVGAFLAVNPGGPFGIVQSGSAYVFVRNGTIIWTEQVKLAASDRATGDQFGASVALSGDTALVGAPGDDSSAGSAYVLLPRCLVDTDNNGNPDNDGDGLCDNWETEGIDVDNDGIIDLELYDENQDGTIDASEQADPKQSSINNLNSYRAGVD